MRFAIPSVHDGAVIDDHGEGAEILPRDRQRKSKRRPDCEGYLDAVLEATPMARRLASGTCEGYAIEQSSIDIERDQADLMLATYASGILLAYTLRAGTARFTRDWC